MWLPFVVFLELGLLLASSVTCLTIDGLSLLSLKSAVDGGSAAISAFSNWNDGDETPCNWSGIECSNIPGLDEPRVVRVSVAGRNLRGYIPSELGELSYLRQLNLHGNNFYGSIPAQLFNASSLHTLFLNSNNLSGPLPPSLCTHVRVENVDFSNNSLSGPLPEFLRNCTELRRLILARNKFSGEIADNIFPGLANLEQLDLSVNMFSGPIPVDIGELKSITGTLNLSFNHFTGNIPETLTNLPLTARFDLRNNDLKGEIPRSGSFANQGPSAFLNNPDLCGFPLQTRCKNDSDFKSTTPDASGNNGVHRKKGMNPGLIILITVADAAAVAFVGMVIVYVYWKKKDSHGCSCTRTARLGGSGKVHNGCVFPCMSTHSFNDSEMEMEMESEKSGGCTSRGTSCGEGELVAVDKGFSFELDELLRASAYVLGKSGIGIVYKVVLGNGVPVAVRRLGEGGQQRYKDFVSEIQVIARVKHPNIVKLRAYYWAPDEKLLISDYISNGNLASALRGNENQMLSWRTRLKIAKGVARGLVYLHEWSSHKFIHGDIKPTNILLDDEFRPYISDFGLKRLVNITGNNPSPGGLLPYVKTSQPEKPNHYRAPEAMISGARPTQKWDVYSFGVVLLEMLTGKSPELSPPTTSTATEVRDLVGWVKRGFTQESPLSEMVDPLLLQEVYAKKEILSVFHIALACTETDPEIRPRIRIVSENLDRVGMQS